MSEALIDLLLPAETEAIDEGWLTALSAWDPDSLVARHPEVVLESAAGLTAPGRS